jgi:uncharacterized protein (TIGR02145 family)
MKTKLLALATTAVLALSCSAALAEGELHIYNWGDYTNPKLIEKFEKQFNVKVSLDEYDSNETMLAKVRAGNSGYDIVVPSDYTVKIMIDEGLLEKTEPNTMPNYKNMDPRFTDIYWDSEKNGKPTLAARLIADACFNNIKMWDYWPEIGVPTNSSTLAILPVGYANLGVTPEITSKSAYPAALFEGTYEFAAFWTADEVADDTNLAYYRYMYQKSPHLMISKGFKSTFGASVRCVRDAD